MSRPPREDDLPWYRQFWPWFIIALPASAVIGGLTTVWIAMQTDDSLVYRSDDGIDVVTERNRAAERNARLAGLAANLMIDAESGAVSVVLRATRLADWPDRLTLQLLHPTHAVQDIDIELLRALPTADGHPTYSGHVVGVPTTRHYVVLADGNAWRLSGEWSGDARIRLGLQENGID